MPLTSKFPRVDNCHSTSHTTCMAPRKPGPYSGPHSLDTHLTIYRPILPSFVRPLSSFRPRPHPVPAHPYFALAFFHRVTPQSFRLCAHRLALGYSTIHKTLFNSDTELLRQRRWAGLSPARPLHIPSFSSFSSTQLAGGVLVYIPPRLAPAKQAIEDHRYISRVHCLRVLVPLVCLALSLTSNLSYPRHDVLSRILEDSGSHPQLSHSLFLPKLQMIAGGGACCCPD